MKSRTIKKSKGLLILTPAHQANSQRKEASPQLSIKSQVKLFSMIDIISLLKKLADGYYHLYNYNCLEAIEEFKKLPSNHLNTGWVLTNMGRAYMEVVRYQDAAALYEQAFKLEPYRMEGI